MADFLDEKRSEIGTRLKELKPVVEEYERLAAAASALDGVPASAVAPARATRAARKGPARSSTNASGRRGRPRGSGTRGAEALAFVKESPGITIPELAVKMGIKQNYLYRVLPALAEDGQVTRDGRGWRPKEGYSQDTPETANGALRGGESPCSPR